MKFLALVLCSLGLLSAQVREGNFKIRVEPSAKLQTGAEIPFLVSVKDDRMKPLTDAKVTLQIETMDGRMTKVYPAPASDVGVYLAKPVFPKSGEWKIYVEVNWANGMTSRTMEFTVPE